MGDGTYSKWQELRIAQLSTSIALFLTYSVAALGFSVNLLVQPGYAISNCIARTSFGLGILLGLLSVALGVTACVTRLKDFRLTAQIVRQRSKPNPDDSVEELRLQSKRLGEWTWRLFYSQIVTFGLQTFALVGALAVTYWHRLV